MLRMLWQCSSFGLRAQQREQAGPRQAASAAPHTCHVSRSYHQTRLSCQNYGFHCFHDPCEGLCLRLHYRCRCCQTPRSGHCWLRDGHLAVARFRHFGDLAHGICCCLQIYPEPQHQDLMTGNVTTRAPAAITVKTSQLYVCIDNWRSISMQVWLMLVS